MLTKLEPPTLNAKFTHGMIFPIDDPGVIKKLKSWEGEDAMEASSKMGRNGS